MTKEKSEGREFDPHPGHTLLFLRHSPFYFEHTVAYMGARAYVRLEFVHASSHGPTERKQTC